MRIPSGVVDQYLYFVAVDPTDFTTRETALTTFTVYRARNGAAAVAMTTPTVAEVSAANMPGVYSLLLDEDMTIGAGNDSEEMVFHITQASMAPVTRTIELYRPKITAGETIGVSSGAVSNVTTVATTTTNTDMRGTDGALLAASAPTNFGDMSITATTGLVDITQAAADKAWGTTTRALTDKAGFTISGTKTTLDALNDITAAGVWSVTLTELAADPGASPAASGALLLPYMAIRNKRDTTAASDEIHNSAGTVLLTATVSDDGTVFTKAKYA